jgi:hypothetical protein
MPDTETKRGPARLQLAMIAALFVGPLLLAAWLYNSGGFTPTGRSNHGLLIEPVVHLPDRHPALTEVARGQWLLIYSTGTACNDDCVATLHAQRQLRLMLGNDMSRVTRVFLQENSTADRVLVDEDDSGLEVLHDNELARDLWLALPDRTPSGGLFLIDPLGNLVMYFQSNLNPRDMVDDIKHLLKLSRIG